MHGRPSLPGSPGAAVQPQAGRGLLGACPPSRALKTELPALRLPHMGSEAHEARASSRSGQSLNTDRCKAEAVGSGRCPLVLDTRGLAIRLRLHRIRAAGEAAGLHGPRARVLPQAQLCWSRPSAAARRPPAGTARRLSAPSASGTLCSANNCAGASKEGSELFLLRFSSVSPHFPQL